MANIRRQLFLIQKPTNKMSNTTKATSTALVNAGDRLMEYVPFGSQDKIRLSINIIRRLIAVPTSTGKMPTDDDCIKFQMMCQAKRLNPFEGDAFMIGYDTRTGPKFSQITAHQVFLKRAEVNEQFNGMESGVIVNRDGELLMEEGDYTQDDDVLTGGWCKVYRKDRDKPYFKRIKLSTFKKESQQWKDNPAGMIVKCAEADSLRTAFPSLLGSLYIREEMTDVAEPSRISEPMFKDATPPKTIEVIAEESESEKNFKKLEALVEKDSVNEVWLIELLQVSGLAGEGCTSLRELNQGDVQKTIDNWDTLMRQIPGGAK